MVREADLRVGVGQFTEIGSNIQGPHVIGGHAVLGGETCGPSILSDFAENRLWFANEERLPLVSGLRLRHTPPFDDGPEHT